MGQKVSSNSHSSNEISLSNKDSCDLKLKGNKFANWSRENINVDVKHNSENNFDDMEQLNNKDNNDDDNDDDDYDDTQKNVHNGTLNANSLAYPSIAELSNFTALNMMRNLEDISLRDEVNEMNERLMDDEKCFNTINYEDISTIQLVENATIPRRDSSTSTNEIKELSQDNLQDVEDDVQEKLACKDLQQSATMTIEEMEKLENLEAKLQRVERERDEAVSKLRLVEVWCEAYEEESKCLEATMESMEEKLRTIINDLHGEVIKSENLERQLSSSLQSLQNLANITRCEKLVS